MEVEERLGHVFPANWEMSERLAVAFCKLTGKMISKVLEQRSHELDVKLLLFAIQRSRMFEDQLSKRYSGSTITGVLSAWGFKLYPGKFTRKTTEGLLEA